MAVALGGAGEKVFIAVTDVDSGDGTVLSLVVTIKLNENPAENRQILTRFGASAFDWVWQLKVKDGNELAFDIFTGYGFGPIGFYSVKTTDVNLVNGGLYRIGITAQGSLAGGPLTRIWVNGVEHAVTIYQNDAVWTNFNNSGTPYTMGTDNNAMNPPLAGDYAEWAAWRAILSDAVMADLTGGRRPDCYPDDAILGVRALTVASMVDWVQAALISNVGATDATHPSVLECPVTTTVVATLTPDAAYTVGSPSSDTVTITE